MSHDTRTPRPPQPPGETARVEARRVLVLAPHPDDEVLGCGGLLAQLAAAGARVRVLLLTDGAATAGTEDGAAHAARRREETRAGLRALGVEVEGGEGQAVRALELPDGALERHLERLARAIEEEVVELRPDLLLVPSPLEVSADHRAAFAALHRVLGPVRTSPGGGETSELAAAARGLTVLVYEINHPAYPDLLVDVGDQLDRLRAAMGHHASQQRHHDYLGAALGLRAFRTLSLPAPASDADRARPAGVVAAEGYRRLTAADFATRSPSQLVRHLGGVPELLRVDEGPRVSVVVRTRDRPALLRQAIDSLAEGSYRRFEVVVVNDGGERPELPDDYPVPLVRVDLDENRGRAAAANAGLAAASGDWVGFLDDDDVASPEHLAVLCGAASAAGVRAVYSDAAVVSLELDPEGERGAGGWMEVERRLPYSRDFDPDLLLVDNYIPFNTLLFERSLAQELERPEGADGPFDPRLEIFEDWEFLIRLAARAPFHHVRRVTCEYRHYRGAGHHALGERPRERADFLAAKARVISRHADRLGPELLARVVDRMRAEAVEAAEEAASARRDRRRADAERSAAEDRYHRLHGEAVALRGEVEELRADAERRGAEIARLHRDEKELRETVEDQTEHLGRTYAEIERLNGILEELRQASMAGVLRWWRDQRKGE